MMIAEYMAAGALGVALIGGGYGYTQAKRVEALRIEVAASQGALMSCGARLNNLLEDIKSDNQIDNLPDDALRVVPDSWLRP